MSDQSPLTFQIISKCIRSQARISKLYLPHKTIDTPVFMPVGTKGTIKGLLPDQVQSVDCHLILGNTYHLGIQPGPELIKKAGGLHKYMNWNEGLLTDSGGFQMVSLTKLAHVTEEGVFFKSPYNESACMLKPEDSISIQNAIGADIIMQLDDVVPSTMCGPQVEEAMKRTIRWLDRCIAAHSRVNDQSIFPIVQGGLDVKLRIQCLEQLTKRNVNGFAIGGLSGGEAKEDFWNIVRLCTSVLPKTKPRYLMGVGVSEDIVVCVALGIDMFDCVYPTRTARFGFALVSNGQLNLKKKKFAKDIRKIEEDCECPTCTRFTRAYLHTIVTRETVGAHLLTMHNISYQMRLMKKIQTAILEQRFPEFVQEFVKIRFEKSNIPKWFKDALESVNIFLYD